MIKLSLFFISCLMVAGCAAQKHEANSIRIMTYNIKYDNKGDSVESWAARHKRVTNLISFYEPDFLGTQEALYNQVQDIDALPQMSYIGVGRDDGMKGGEFSALFYNDERFELVAGTDSTIWLSDTPGKPTKDWGAGWPRILTWGQFKDRQNSKKLWVFNTHFDNVSAESREKGAKLILKTIHKFANDEPVVLTGDFNSTPQDEPHAILTGKNGLNDTYSDSSHIGPEFTYGGFEVNGDTERHRIDYIYINNHFAVDKYVVISDFRGKYYPSDHLPVLSDLKLK